MKKKKVRLGQSSFTSYQMMGPWLILFVTFMFIPVAAAIVLSFTSFDMLNMPKINWFENYIRLFLDDDVFMTSLKNTLIIAVITGPIGFFLSFMLAWMVNEFGPTIRTILSFLFYAPALTGNVYFVWQVLFSGDAYGYMNSLLISLGLITDAIQWLKNPQYVLTIIVIVQLWQSMGVSFLANISGLQNVSRDMYEAGAIDGIRNRWQELRYITLPSMSNMLLFSAVMQIQSSFSVSAIAITLAGYPSKSNAVDTIVSLMQDMATVRYELGYASAIAVVLFIMMVTTRLLVGRILSTVEK